MTMKKTCFLVSALLIQSALTAGSYSRSLIRMEGDLRDFNAPHDVVRDAVPAFWVGDTLYIEVGFFDSGSLVDVSNIGSAVCEIKALVDGGPPDEDAAALMSETESSFDSTLTLGTWRDLSKQHCRFDFAASETNITPGDVWMVIWVVMDDGSIITTNAGIVKARQDAGGTANPPDPPESADFTYVTEAENISALEALDCDTWNTGAAVYVEGHTTRNDGGEGMFWLDKTGSLGASAENGGTIIVANCGTNCYWRRIYQTTWVRPEWFGGFDADDAEDLTAITAALAVGDVQLGRNTYLINDNLDMLSHKTIRGHGAGVTTIKVMDGTATDDGSHKFRAIGDFSSRRQHVTLEGFTLDCNFDGQPTEANGRIHKTISGIGMKGEDIKIRDIEIKNTGVGDGYDSDMESFAVIIEPLDAADTLPNVIENCAWTAVGDPALMNEDMSIICITGFFLQDAYGGQTGWGENISLIRDCVVDGLDFTGADPTVEVHCFQGNHVVRPVVKNITLDTGENNFVRGVYQDTWELGHKAVTGGFFDGVSQGVKLVGTSAGSSFHNVRISGNYIRLKTWASSSEMTAGIHIYKNHADSVLKNVVIDSNYVTDTAGSISQMLRFQVGDTTGVENIQITSNVSACTNSDRDIHFASSSVDMDDLWVAGDDTLPVVRFDNNYAVDGGLIVPYDANLSALVTDPLHMQESALGIVTERRQRTWAGDWLENPYTDGGLTPWFVGELVRNETHDEETWLAVGTSGAAASWQLLTIQPDDTHAALDTADAITPKAETLTVTSSGGNITLAGGTIIESGAANGQRLTLVGGNGTDKITLDDGNCAGASPAVRISGNFTVDYKDTISFIQKAGEWLETSRSDN